MTAHSVRVRGTRWEKVEKKAWELSTKAKKVTKEQKTIENSLNKWKLIEKTH